MKLVALTNSTPPSPTLSLERVEPGLRVYASASGSRYQRQNIRTVNPAYSWVDATAPVTYSFTLADYPGTNHAGFQSHIFLVPGESLPNFETSPDYNQPNIVFLDIQNNASGGAYATFRYKTNQPSGNTMIYNADLANGPVGALAGIGSAHANGTWSLTFSNKTSVTLTAPGGSSTNFALPSEAADLFAGPLYAYFGIQPNQPENIYQFATFKRVQITGVATPIDESFAGVQPSPDKPLDLDPQVWERVAENNPGVVLIPAGTAFQANWTVPAAGFKLQTAPALGTTAAWTDVAATPVQIGNQVRALVSTESTNRAAFFRLIK